MTPTPSSKGRNTRKKSLRCATMLCIILSREQGEFRNSSYVKPLAWKGKGFYHDQHEIQSKDLLDL